MSQPGNDDPTKSHVILSQGTMVSFYRIISKVGAGGMGEVFLAEDTRLNRKVALKFLPAHLSEKEEVRSRFLRETQALAKLNHPNIVAIHDVNEFNGRPYYVMEYVEGKPLHDLAHDKPLQIDMIIEYAIQICQGLGEAHRAGIVHRDVKSSNIAIDHKGRVRLLDFGLAAIEGDEHLTKTGSTLGTVAYMSPEQVSGREIDHRSDLFSFGIVLYELIAGRSPFKRDSEGATLKAIMQDMPEPLSRYKSDVPQKLQEVVFKLLEKDRELRCQSAEDVIADLKRLMYDSRQSVQSVHSQIISTKSKKTGLYIGLAAGLVVLAAIASFIFLKPSSSRKTTSDNVPMIAVLPFDNLGSAEDEYFADGMTEEITSRLAGIKGLGVISRTSSMKYKTTDKSLTEIGRELGVDYILEGTVRWSKVGGQSKVRITPQLVRVSDDRHMWAENYERALMEVFEVQADIATKIVEQLGIALLESDREDLALRPTENATAYDFYLKALSAYRTFIDFNYSAQLEAKQLLDSAVKLDSNFALAFALRAKVYSGLAFESPSSEEAAVAKASAEKALKLQPGLPMGHDALGTFYNLVQGEYELALEEFNLAKSELHNDPDLLSSIAFVRGRQGRNLEAQEIYQKAAELDPINPIRHSELSYSLECTHSFADAEQAIRRAITLKPDDAIFNTKLIQINVRRYGDWTKIKPVVMEALKHVDTLEFISNSWWLAQWLPELPWEKLVNDYIERKRDTADLALYYENVAWGHFALKDSTKALLYIDSSLKVQEQSVMKKPEEPFATSFLGLTCAVRGDCERAIELGQKGKELLSIDECHW